MALLLSSSNIVFTSINFIILIIGVAGNVVLIGYYLMRRKKLLIIDLEILNLVISDLGYVIFSCTYSILGYFSNNHPIFAELSVGCRYFFIPIAIFSRATSLLMVLIALTRYAKIVHPNLFHRIFTKSNTIIIMACIWCVGITMPSLSVYDIWGEMIYFNTTGLCAISYLPNQSLANMTFLITSVSCSYYLPLVVICLCYVSISRANAQSQRNILNHSQQSRLGSISSVSRLLRKADTLQLHTSISIICIIYLISYTPYVICHTIQLAGLITIDSYQKNFLLVFMCINSFSNPVIFTIIRCKSRKQQMVRSVTAQSFKTTYLADNAKTFADIRSVISHSQLV